MAQVFLDDSKLVSMADALREATETTEPLVFPEGFNAAISSLTNGVKLPELTNPASENHVLQGYEIIDENGEVKLGNIPSQEGKTVTPTTSEQVAVVSGVYTTGEVKVAAMPTATQATPSISVDEEGLITASTTQSAGYVSEGTKSNTKQLTTQEAKTVTPSANEQTAVEAGVYTTGVVKVAAVPAYNGEMTGVGSLENTPWEQVKEIAIAGIGENYWAIGDTKSVELNGTVGIVNLVHQKYLFCIIGFNHNESYEGKGIHFMLEKTVDGTNITLTDSNYTNANSSVSFRYNLSDINTGGWQGSYLRNTICQSFYEALPSDLKSVLDGCIKYTDNVGGTSMAAENVTATNDKIFIPSEFEIFGVKTGANNAEQNYQKQYDYYVAGNSKVKYCSHNLGERANWWLRSPDNNGSYALGVSIDRISGFRATNSFGLVPCFKVGA